MDIVYEPSPQPAGPRVVILATSCTARPPLLVISFWRGLAELGALLAVDVHTVHEALQAALSRHGERSKRIPYPSAGIAVHSA